MANYSSYKIALGYTGDWSIPQHAHIDATEAVATAVEGLSSVYQAKDATLTALAGVTTAANKLIYATGSDTFSTTTFTTAGRALVDDADAAAQRTTLGLGTISTQAASSVAITGGAIDGTTIGATTATTGKFTTVTASTGILFGTDTAAANTLDDYEEGTWTPVFSGAGTTGTYELQTNSSAYTKIGDTVFAKIDVRFASSLTGGGSGSFQFTLPVAASNTSNSPFVIYHYGMTATKATSVAVIVSQTIGYFVSIDNTGTQQIEVISNVVPDSYFRTTLIYKV